MKTVKNSKQAVKNVNPKEGEKNMKDEKKNVKPGVIASTKNNTVKAPVKKMAPVEAKKPAPAKVVETKTASKPAIAEKVPAKPAKIEKGSKIKELLAFCEPLFTKGIKESDLMEKLAAKFPQTAVPTFKTQVYKCRSLKYTKLPKLVVKEKDGTLKFA